MSELHGTSSKTRKRPYILVTGTPGVGKTTTASLLAERIGFKHICVGDLVKENKFYDGHDEKLDSHILDEEKLLDHMEEMLKESDEEGTGVICDYHSCELFPERWFDLILVLRANTDVLFDRLTERGYPEKKRQENMQCEIMQVLLDEANEAYNQDIVQELPSNTIEDLESNIERVQVWLEQWLTSHQALEED